MRESQKEEYCGLRNSPKSSMRQTESIVNEAQRAEKNRAPVQILILSCRQLHDRMLLRIRGLSEDEEPADCSKMAGRIKQLHDVISRSLAVLSQGEKKHVGRFTSERPHE